MVYSKVFHQPGHSPVELPGTSAPLEQNICARAKEKFKS